MPCNQPPLPLLVAGLARFGTGRLFVLELSRFEAVFLLKRIDHVLMQLVAHAWLPSRPAAEPILYKEV